jgi:uncharacterized membrane protein
MSNPIQAKFKTEWLPVLLIIVSVVLSLYFYQHFPARVATHWDFQGQVNGYSSRAAAAGLWPVMMLALYLLFLVLPYLDPRREKYVEFAGVYHQFKNLMVIFIFILFLLTGLNGLGYTINMGLWIPVLMGALLAVIGLLLNKVKMNWFMGIRTPWTMSSEAVWNKTHQASGKVFLLSGLLIAATALVPAGSKIILFILALAVLVFALPVYSYLLYAKEKKGETAKK